MRAFIPIQLTKTKCAVYEATRPEGLSHHPPHFDSNLDDEDIDIFFFWVCFTGIHSISQTIGDANDLATSQ